MPIAKARSRSVRNGFTRSFFLAERAICLVDYSVVKCKKIISDFEKMKADPVDVADLMLFYVEIGCRFTLAYGDIDEPFYDSFARYFDKTMKYIRANNLMSVYRALLGFVRIQRIRFPSRERFTATSFSANASGI